MEPPASGIDILFLDTQAKSLYSTHEAFRWFLKKIQYLVWMADPEEFEKTTDLTREIHYLPLPLTPNQFRETIRTTVGYMDNFGHIDPFATSESIFLKSPESGIGHIRCALAEITVIEILGGALKIHTVARGIFSTNLSLSKIESGLAPKYFIRIHRSFIVSKHYIDHVLGNIIYMLYYKPELVIGDTYQKSVKDMLEATTWK